VYVLSLLHAQHHHLFSYAKTKWKTFARVRVQNMPVYYYPLNTDVYVRVCVCVCEREFV